MHTNPTLAWRGFLLTTLAVCVCGSVLAAPHTPPRGRVLPSIAHHIDSAAVILVSGACVHAAAATKVGAEWVAKGSDLQSLDLIDEGAIVNDGTSGAIAVSLSGTEVYFLEPGETMLVGAEAASGYVRGCVCKCGNGWVFVSDADCGGSSCQCNGQGPCIDPTNHQIVDTGFAGCKRGWGQGPSVN